jgi:hypothetical protein
MTGIGFVLNEKMVREGYAEIMYIPPSEFDSRKWEADYTSSSSLTLSPRPTLFDFAKRSCVLIK